MIAQARHNPPNTDIAVEGRHDVPVLMEELLTFDTQARHTLNTEAGGDRHDVSMLKEGLLTIDIFWKRSQFSSIM